MSYEVIARKWRPQQFDEVVGQRVVTEALKNAIRSGRIAHAFLFSGVRGVGKTTTARILAKSLNCSRGTVFDPCDTCDSCQEIWESRSVDVQEIDAASNRGIENIRELREGVRYGTARDRFKIFIIDEVHMLTREAFNALLKTLEEPPPHVKFILATTEPLKIPVTIRSRCQHYDFRPIAVGGMLERLRMICAQEGIEISEFGLRSVATVARGSMRDAQSTLDKVLALGGTKVSDEDVRAILGVVDEEVLVALVDLVSAHDRKGLLEQLQELAESGIEPGNLCQKLMGHVRNLMVCRAAGWQERLLNLTESEKEPLLRQCEDFTELDLIRFYDLLTRVLLDLRSHPQPFLHLEMALVKLVELARLPSLEEVVSRLEKGDRSSASSPATADAALSSSSGPSDEPSGGTSKPQEDSSRRAEQSSPDTLVTQLETVLSQQHPSFFSLLGHASSMELKPDRLVVVFAPSETSFYQVLNEPEKRELLSQLCAEITGSPVSVELLIGKESSEADWKEDPTQDPRVQTFLKEIPGKIQLERKVES